MSYILDALKKSEQERRRGEIPELSHYETDADSEGAKLKLWPIIVGVLVLVNVVVLVIWAPWNANVERPQVVESNVIAPSTPSPAGAAQPATPMEATAKAQKRFIQEPKYTRQPAPVEDLPVEPAAKPAPKPVVAAAPKVAPRVEEPEVIKPSYAEPAPSNPVETSYLPQLQELPQGLQSQIPDMNFSSHMYSSSSRFRSITINGRRLKEGQFLDDRIQVREITEKGVILGLDGTLFEVDVLGQWVN